MSEPDKLAYNVNEAAAALGVSRRTVYELVSKGDLSLFKLGGRSLIRRDTLQAYIDRLSGGAKVHHLGDRRRR